MIGQKKGRGQFVEVLSSFKFTKSRLNFKGSKMHDLGQGEELVVRRGEADRQLAQGAGGGQPGGGEGADVVERGRGGHAQLLGSGGKGALVDDTNED